MRRKNMASEKLYRNEIVFYVVNIFVALAVRVYFPFESFSINIEPIGSYVSLIVYWLILTLFVQGGSFLCYAIVATMGFLRGGNVPQDRYLSPRNFAISTSSVVTSFTAERVYQTSGSLFWPMVLIVPLVFYLTYELAWRVGPWSFS
jgi:hypothetical protein